MNPGRRRWIGLLTLAGAALLVAGLALEEPWFMPSGAGCGLLAGLLGWLATAPPATAPAAPSRAPIAEMAPLLRELAEEMVRLKRDSAEASRGMAEARASGARMVQAASQAIARLDESAETSAIAARALSMLPGIADNHAQRIELMAARAEQALAMVPESLAVPPPFEAALARLEGIALPDTDALRDAVARLDRLPGEIGQAMHGSLAEAHDAAAALLDQASARIEAARPDPLLAVGLMEATERLDALAPPMERARESAEALAARLEDALERDEHTAAGLAAALERLEATPSLERLDAAIGRIASFAEALPAGHERLVGLLTDALADLPGVSPALLAMDAAASALPAMTEAAQRASEALLRAAQANIALASRAREAAPTPEPEPAEAAPELAAPELAAPELAPPGLAAPELAVPECAAPEPTAREATAPEPFAEPTPAEPSRPPRLLENLDQTIRGLQSISDAIAAAAERRLETAS